jgi:hypothetical protein
MNSRFYFLLSADQIVGYVHLSDLNKADAKTAFFALFQAVERRIWERIGDRIRATDLHPALPDAKPKTIKDYIAKQRRDEKNNVDVGWATVFDFHEILKLARYYRLVALDDGEIKLLNEMRNRTAHSSRTLLRKEGG